MKCYQGQPKAGKIGMVRGKAKQKWGKGKAKQTWQGKVKQNETWARQSMQGK